MSVMELGPPPEGLERALSWDLSPRRPWEDAVCDAALWTEAVALRRAFEEGERDARLEKAALDEPYGDAG